MKKLICFLFIFIFCFSLISSLTEIRVKEIEQTLSLAKYDKDKYDRALFVLEEQNVELSGYPELIKIIKADMKRLGISGHESLFPKFNLSFENNWYFFIFIGVIILLILIIVFVLIKKNKNVEV